MKEYLYSEIFGKTIQGEGRYTGIPTVWLRLFACNLSCNGFGQKDPTDSSTYKLPYLDLAEEIKAGNKPTIKVMEDLPVFEYGCDSSYSWAAGYKKLQRKGTADEISNLLIELNTSQFNPEGIFYHPKTGQDIHLCFTGGEPLMPRNQECIVEVLEQLKAKGRSPSFITFETNGTQELTESFIEHFRRTSYVEVLFSVSPKLWTVAGEKNEKAIKPKIVDSYIDKIWKSALQMKFVMGTEPRQWEELEKVISLFEEEHQIYDHAEYWIMPVGATSNGQDKVQAKVAEMAIERGYNVAVRAHVFLFGNVIGK